MHSEFEGLQHARRIATRGLTYISHVFHSAVPMSDQRLRLDLPLMGSVISA
jgi:hypothetical protein